MGDDFYKYEINQSEKELLIGDAFELACAAQEADSREKWAVLSRRFDEQMEEWREIGSADGAKTRWKDNDEDDYLWEQFSSHRFEFRELRDSWFEANRARAQLEREPMYRQAAAIKQSLIEKINDLVGKDPFGADKAAEELFAQWKLVGHVGDSEAALWDSFNTTRRSIKDAKKNLIDSRKAKSENAALQKHEIIREAAQLCRSSDWDSVARRINELHHAWKAAGSAGRTEASLWEEFCDWTNRCKQRRAALQRGEPDPFPAPATRPDVSIIASTGAIASPVATAPIAPPAETHEQTPSSLVEPQSALGQMPPSRRARLVRAVFICLCLFVLLSWIGMNLSSMVRPAQQATVGGGSKAATHYFRKTSPTISCLDYQKLRVRLGKPYEIGCNARTADGYFWQVQFPRIRPYGYWGMRGVGSTPPCRSPKDVGRRAETAVFKTAATVWDVRAYWCRQSQQSENCHGRSDEGPIFGPGTSAEGVFSAVCTKQ